MSPELVVFALFRVAGSLPVLRWPFGGGLLAIGVDFADLFVRDILGAGAIGDYQAVDKWLDQVYLGAFLLVALRWPGRGRAIAVALYAYRLLGFGLFELAGDRLVLVLFPNVFEVWFLLLAFRAQRGPLEDWTAARTTVALVGCLAVKLVQEVGLHGLRLFDGYSTFDALELLWRFLTGGVG